MVDIKIAEDQTNKRPKWPGTETAEPKCTVPI